MGKGYSAMRRRGGRRGRGEEGNVGGDERNAEGAQAINTTRRHARRQATPTKARFIRARTNVGRVDFYRENPPTAGSLVSNYRNAVALGHSCSPGSPLVLHPRPVHLPPRAHSPPFTEPL